ncbi:MAG: molybdate ABC transporter substrate-binding protein [Thermodesulfobacteriota bacterium]|nr:molybdate ABC transporter substrate-binding protein [Thermodesulfobacteriota bacterium]
MKRTCVRNTMGALAVLLIFVVAVLPAGAQEAESIMVYSGAGMRKPMDEIGGLFQKKFGTKVHYNYAGSNALLSQMQLTKKGDAYMPGATLYIDIAREKGLIGYQQGVAYHIPVITVPKGNPANISGLKDLARPDVRLVFGDPKVAAIGKIGNKILKKNDLKDAVWAKGVDTTATMNELIIYIAMEQADASINWWDTVKFVGKIEVIEIPKEKNVIKVIPIGVTTFSKHPVKAKQFVDFCASEEGKGIFEKHGFITYPNPEYE